MKRFLIGIILCLLMVAPAMGADRSIVPATLFSLAPSAANTTGTTKTAVFDMTRYQHGVIGNFWFSQVGGLTTYGAVSAYFLPANENTDVAWENAERIPILLNENAVTGVTTKPSEFSGPACRYGRFEYEVQQTVARQDGADGGVSLWGHALFQDANTMLDVAPVRCGPTVSYVINTSSGTSSLTVPKGTRKMIISLRGSDIVWRPDGQNVTANSDYTLSQGDYLILTSREQCDNFRFGEADSGTGSTVFATPYTK